MSSIGKDSAQGKQMLGPTSVIRHVMHNIMRIHVIVSDCMQDLCKGVWQELVEKLKDMLLGQRQLVKDSRVEAMTEDCFHQAWLL